MRTSGSFLSSCQMLSASLWLMVRLKDICSMTKEKTACLIPNAIQLCTDNEKPLCPKELWHFVYQCYGNELGLTSDDEDYVPPDEDFNTMGYCEELPVEDSNEHNNDTNDTLTKNTETKPIVSPVIPHKAFPNNTPPEPSTDSPVSYDLPPAEDISSPLPDTDLLILPKPESRSHQHSSHGLSPLRDLNINEDLYIDMCIAMCI
ncbi:hypothetical protein PAMP_007581 [Pampus punctatissimus]